jgi:Caspase domain
LTRQRYGLLIGVSEYAGLADSLESVPSSLSRLRETLQAGLAPEFCYSQVDIKLNDQADTLQLENNLRTLGAPGNHKQNPLILVLAGHGCVHQGRRYFMTYGCPAGAPGLELSHLNTHIGLLGGRPLLILFDFCHSGELTSLAQLRPFGMTTGPEVAILAACRAEEKSPSSAPGGSLVDIFTDALTLADPDESGIITWASVTRYVNQKYRSHPGTPQEFRSDLGLLEEPLNRVSPPADPMASGSHQWVLVFKTKHKPAIATLRRALLDDDIVEE